MVGSGFITDTALSVLLFLRSDFGEFTAAVRKGGKMTGAMISDSELRTLFDATDEDGSGDVSIEELTSFVWGEPEKAAAPEPERAKEPEPKPAEPEVQVSCSRATAVPVDSA